MWQGSPHLPAVAGRDRHRRLVDGVNAAGAAVVQIRPLRVTDTDRYVHRTNESTVVRPYTALLSLGDLGGDRSLQAIGQSRHLGGGLLTPQDHAHGSTLHASTSAPTLPPTPESGAGGR